MIIYLLILFLLILLFFVYKIFNKEILSPSIITIVTFLLTLILFVFNKQSWGVEDLRIKTAFVIASGILIVFIAEYIVRLIFQHNNKLPKYKYISHNGKDEVYIHTLSKASTSLIIIVMSIFVVLYYENIIEISKTYALEQNIFLGYRKAIKLGYAHQGTYIVLINVINSAFGYFFAYLFITNQIFRGGKIYYYLLPVLLYLINIALSTSRIQLIFFTIFVLVLYYILNQIKFGWIFSLNNKFIKKVIFFVIILFIVFYLLGLITQKSSGKNFFNYISVYACASVPAFDEMLTDFNYDISNFGEYTLMGVRNILARIGLMERGISGERHMDFIIFGDNQTTNVYTCFGRLMYDYGFLGMLIFRFLWSTFYSFLYLKIRYSRLKRNEPVIIFFLALLFHSIPMQAIDETFLNSTLGLSVLIEFIFIIILFRISTTKKIYIRNLEK